MDITFIEKGTKSFLKEGLANCRNMSVKATKIKEMMQYTISESSEYNLRPIPIFKYIYIQTLHFRI